MIHNLLYETKVTGVNKLLKVHVKIRRFSMGYCKDEQKKYIVSYKTSSGQDMQYNVDVDAYIFLHYIYFFFFNFHELLLSIFIIFTNTAAGRYFKKTTIINISKYFCSFIISAGNYLLFVEHLYSIFGVFFSFLGSGGRGFYHFQELNTSADF